MSTVVLISRSDDARPTTAMMTSIAEFRAEYNFRLSNSFASAKVENNISRFHGAHYVFWQCPVLWQNEELQLMRQVL